VESSRKFIANRPDIKIKNKKEQTCTLIYVAIPADKNVVQKETMNLKYKSLCVELQRLWNLKYTIVSVIFGATGILTRRLTIKLEGVPVIHSIDTIQKTAILGTSLVICTVLQFEA